MNFYSNVARQLIFESKDCHSRMKISVISIILRDNYFLRNGNLEFYADRLKITFGILQLCDSGLSLNSTRKPLKLLVRGSLSFLQESQLKEGIRGKILTRRRVLYHVTVSSFARCQ